MPLRDLVLLLFFVISMPICFIRPFYGVLLWSIVAFMNPQSYIWGGASFFPWALAVAVATLAGMIFFSGGFRKLASREVLVIIALWLWFTATSLNSSQTSLFMNHAVDTWYRWQFVSKILLMTLAAIVIVDSFSRLRIFVLVMSGCFGLYVLKSFPFVILTGGVFRLYGPDKSMIADNNDFGLALDMTLPMFFYLSQTEEKRWVRWSFGVVFLITILAIFFTYSRGALVGLVAVLVLMFLQSKRRLVLVPVVAIGLVVALLFTPAAWRERMDPTRPDAVDVSAMSRLNAWSFSWNLAADYPIAGGGFDTFTRELFARYAPNVADTHGPHSIYFQVLAEHGFVGLALYLTLLVCCFATLRRLRKRARSFGDPLIANYANMFRFSLVGFLAAGTFLGRAYFDYFFAIVACIVILDKVSQRDRSESHVLELVPEEEEQMA